MNQYSDSKISNLRKRLEQDQLMLTEYVIKIIYSHIVKSGDDCVDGGAHVAFHTKPLAFCCSDGGTVYAFEVLPTCLDTIEKVIYRNSIKNIKVINRALMRIPQGKMHFHFFPEDPGYSGLKKRDIDHMQCQLLEVKSTSLDHELAGCHHLRFMKLDLEGGEFDAMNGGKNVISKHKPMIIFENSREYSGRYFGYTGNDFFDFFDELEYHVYDIMGTPFRRENWAEKGLGYSIAVVANSEDENFVTDILPGLLSACAQSVLYYEEFLIPHKSKLKTDVTDDMLKYRLAKAEEALDAVYNSHSWKIATPLRSICSTYRRLKNQMVRNT